MKLLVTGGAGYVGSVCAAHLVDAGHEVAVLDDLSTGHADAVPDGAQFVEGDLGEAADEVLADGFDGVLHFAARSLVGESVQRPELYWRGNVVAAPAAARRHAPPRHAAAGVLLDRGDLRRARAGADPRGRARPGRPTPTARASSRSTT